MKLNRRGAHAAGVLATAVAMSTFATTANAQEDSSGFYFGAFGGQSTYDVGSAEDFDAVIEETVGFFGGAAIIEESSLDEKDTSFGVVAGYRFNSYFGLEVGYVDLGAAEYSGEGLLFIGGPPLSFDANASIEASGPTASIVGMLPLAETFDLYGKAGIFFADTEISVDVEGETDGISATSQDTLVGVGAAWRIGETWSLNFEFTRFLDVGDEEETGEGDIDQLAVGFTFNL
jgi:OOP family OmpA-OmpF porin